MPISSHQTEQQKMGLDTRVVIAGVVLIIFLLLLNMGLCYWIGFNAGTRSTRKKNKTSSVPHHDPRTGHFIPIPQVTSMPTFTQPVGQVVHNLSSMSSQADPRKIPVSRVETVCVSKTNPGSEGRTLMGITCAPQAHPSVTLMPQPPPVPEVRRQESPAQSYDSSVFTEDPMSPASEEEEGGGGGSLLHKSKEAAAATPITRRNGQRVLFYDPRSRD